MQKTILITGATDGIGLKTAKILAVKGHIILLHGRNPAKLEKVTKEVSLLSDTGGQVKSYLANLSILADVVTLAKSVSKQHKKLDVLINNAGVFKTPHVTTTDGLDVRFAVNTIAPYMLTKRLLPLCGTTGRIINLSSAAQSPVHLEALAGQKTGLTDMEAYAQSKLAITMWTYGMAHSLGSAGPTIMAVNPGSMLGTKMVKEAFGVAGHDIRIGADILVSAALEDKFLDASGKYFDNDKKQFASPHPDALNVQKCKQVIDKIEQILSENSNFEMQ